MINTQNKLPLDVMWRATVACDRRFDGEFFYAVKTTGIFCRPSCKSKTPHFKNVRFFEKARDARNEEFRPCKRCRPDLQVKVYDPHDCIVKEVKGILDKRYYEKILLKDLAIQVGVSAFYLNRLFKEKTGLTPRMYLENVRMKKAMDLLLTTDLNSTDICFKIGYESLSSFYKAFKSTAGCTPKQFRLKRKGLKR